MADQEVEDALAHSFLARLPPEVRDGLRAEGERADYPAGTTVYRAGSAPQAALVVGGLLRVFLTSAEGRQVTVRYARPGDVLGIAVLVGGPASTSVQAVEPSSVFRVSARTLIAAARRRQPAPARREQPQGPCAATAAARPGRAARPRPDRRPAATGQLTPA